MGILTQLWHKCLEPLSRSSTCRDCKCRDKEALREELLQWSRLLVQGLPTPNSRE